MRTTLLGTLILTLLAIAITAGTALAQTTPQLEQLQVDLRPEFDQPDMLVIYRANLSADTSLPAKVTLRVPARVGVLHAVAYDDGTGNLMNASYTTSTNDDWLVVTLDAPTSVFQLEFYDTLTRLGDQRSYTFVWPGDYAVDQFSVSLLPPLGATEIRSEPMLSPFQQDEGSLLYVGNLGSLAANQESQVTVSYRGAKASVGELSAPPSDDDGNNTLLIGGLIGAALLLVVAGTLWYTRQSKPQPAMVAPPQSRAKRKRRSPQPLKVKDGPAAAGYCTQCGHVLDADDRFCRSCGTPVS